MEFRKLRLSHSIRKLTAQVSLNPQNFIMPYFVTEGVGIKNEIPSLPGIYHFSLDKLIDDLYETLDNKVNTVLLFGVSPHKDALGSYAYCADGIVQRAIRKIKETFASDICVMADVCLCGYTNHGHCGILSGNKIDNAKTTEILAKIAVSYAKAGADFTAPSAMMDKQVKAIRDELDIYNFKDTGIMAYSAKFASALYGPFREAVDSAPAFGDRKTYQLDYSNYTQPMLEIKADMEEGTDIIMVKPAITNLDILNRAKNKFNIIAAAYQVSGEYAMIKKLASNPTEEKNIALEMLTSIKRAGADIIISYYAKNINKWIQ